MNLNEKNLLLDLLVESLGSPGIVLDEERARATPCRCLTVQGKELCHSAGIIGTLTGEQVGHYCPSKIAVPDGRVARVAKFVEAAGTCQAEIASVPKGERLEPWLSCMGRELAQRGIKI